MNYRLKKISGDASFREFYRLKKGNKTSIIVKADKEKFKNLISYAIINNLLIKNKIIVTGIMPGGFIGYKNAMWRLKKKNTDAYTKFIKSRLPAGKMFKAKDLMPIIDTICSKQVTMLSGSLIVMDAGEGRAYYN